MVIFNYMTFLSIVHFLTIRCDLITLAVEHWKNLSFGKGKVISSDGFISNHLYN